LESILLARQCTLDLPLKGQRGQGEMFRVPFLRESPETDRNCSQRHIDGDLHCVQRNKFGQILLSVDPGKGHMVISTLFFLDSHIWQEVFWFFFLSQLIESGARAAGLLVREADQL
jgi:hypothetical protein